MKSSKKFKVYCTQPLEPEGIEILEKVAEVEVNPKGRTMTIQEAKEVAIEYNPDAFLSTWAEPNRIFSREVLEAAKNLKVIGWVGVAFEHFDLDVATERGVYCTFLKDVAEKWIAPMVADEAFALLLGAARKLHLADNYVKGGEVGNRRMLPGSCFHGGKNHWRNNRHHRYGAHRRRSCKAGQRFQYEHPVLRHAAERRPGEGTGS